MKRDAPQIFGSSPSRPPIPALGVNAQIQEIVPYGVFTTDTELRIGMWNPWLASNSGLTQQFVSGRPLGDVFPDLVPRRLLDRYRRALNGEVCVLSAALHKYLLAFPASVPESGLPNMLQTARIAPIPSPDGIVGTITIIEDVTQREFQAGIVNRQQELDRLLSDALATLVVSNDPVHDMEGIFSTVRLALGLDAYGSFLMEPDGKTLRLNGSVGIAPRHRDAMATILIPDDDRTRLEKLAAAGASVAGDPYLEIFKRMGVRGQCVFALSVGAQLIGFVAFGSYVRESIGVLDAHVLARIARYVAIAVDRDRRVSETRRASRAKDEFLAALSHELRTPLNPVLLVASDGSQNSDFPEEVRDSFRIIEKNALLEARLIDDLLDLTRISNGKLALEMHRMDLVEALQDALDTVKGDLALKKQVLTANLGAGSRLVMGDSARLQQVFWNLLKNAVKFTPEGGRIAVSCEADPKDGTIAVSISDTGIGMEAHEISRFFEAFAQGERSGRAHRFGGLGLGLAISLKLVELHGGSIGAESRGAGKGSTFTVRLPVLADSAQSPDSASGSVSPGGGSREPFAKARRILLVEDHEATRASLAVLLARRGYEVEAVGTVKGAIDAAARGGFDLILSDIGLPDGDGVTLMRDLNKARGLPAIAITGYGMPSDVARSRDAGFLAHITKPISVDVLDRALERRFGPVSK